MEPQNTIITAEEAAVADSALRRIYRELATNLVDLATHSEGAHINIAGHLRVLLCDKKFPLLIRFAEYRKVPLLVWGCRPPAIPARLEKHVPFTIGGDSIASVNPFESSKLYSIQQFLDVPLGIAPLHGFRGTPAGEKYTTRDVVKWVANKEGFAHFDLIKPKGLEFLKGITNQGPSGLTITAFGVKKILYQVGVWTVEMAYECLR